MPYILIKCLILISTAFTLVMANSAEETCANTIMAPAKKIYVRWAQVDFPLLYQKLQEAGISLEIQSFRGEFAAPATEVLTRELGSPVGPHSFIHAVRMKYGGWYEGLRENGINTTGLQSHYPMDSSGAEITSTLRRLYANRFDLNPRAMRQGQNGPQAIQIILQEMGYPLTSGAFYKKAMLRFGSWNRALAAASIAKLGVVRQEAKVNWTRAMVLEAIGFLTPRMEDMSSSNVLRERDRVALLLYFKFGKVLSSKTLLRVATTEFGDWQTAVRAAPKADIKSPSSKYQLGWSREVLKGVISELAKKGAPLDPNGFLGHEQLVKRITAEIFLAPMAASEIYKFAVEFYGTWAEAVAGR